MTAAKQMNHRDRMKPGQDLVMTGCAGQSGTSVIAERREAELLKYFTKQFVHRCRCLCDTATFREEAFYIEAGVSDIWPAGEGGILTALWNLFEECGLGFEIELRALPILQETVEICEIFDINPYRLQSKGCTLLTADNGGDLVRYLEKQGIHGVVIGKVESGIKKQILNGEIRSFLDRPKPDELYKI